MMANLTIQLISLGRRCPPKLRVAILCRAASSPYHSPSLDSHIHCRSRQFSTIYAPILKIHSSLQGQTCSINLTPLRFRKKRGRTSKVDDDEEEDDEDEALANENPLLVDDLFDARNDGSQELTIDVNSLRLDSVCKTGFSMTRAKVEETFYSGDIHVNGERASKKSQDLSLNDEIDILKGPDPDDPKLVHVKRIIIAELPDKASEQGRFKMKIKRWQDLTVEAPSQRGED